MTSEDLAAALQFIFGPGHGWKARAAAALGIDAATLRRQLNGQSPIPGPVIAAVRCWLESKSAPKP